MAFTTTLKTSGGAKLKAILDKAEKAKAARAKQIKVGFFSTAEYDDGTKIAGIAAVNEFGLANVPERPFMRQAAAILEDKLPGKLKGIIDPATLTVDAAAADKIGEYAVEVVKERIVDLKEPPNTPSTLMQKRGDVPLVDTGEMLAAVDYEAE